MQPTIVLFTRDLRVHDHPALAAACESGEVLPLFVLDDTILEGAAPNRIGFLLESLQDLRATLRRAGGDLWVRRGDVVAEAVKIARRANAGAIYLSDDASRHARTRVARLRGCAPAEVVTFPGIAAVEPGAVAPAGGDHYRVFTPYHRAWSRNRKRPVASPPAHLRVPSAPGVGRIPALEDVASGARSPEVVPGGETAGRKRAATWLEGPIERYEAERDVLAADSTSRLSAYLHFGCVSSRELIAEAPRTVGGRAFVRQLCWRDFFLQVLAAEPDYPRSDYKPAPEPWVTDEGGLDRWKQGMTGVPLVDAGMRQLLHEGWMHNRARLVTASYLTRTLRLDWRAGAAHFADLLVDGDLASNSGNWQWVAGTGNATRRGAAMNPLRQAKRFDPTGDYVRRWVPELEGLDAPFVHEPLRLDEREFRARGYPSIGLGTAQPTRSKA